MKRRHGYMLFALIATVAATWWAASVDDGDASAGDVQAGNGRSAAALASGPAKANIAKRGSKTLADNQAVLLAQLSSADTSRSAPPKLTRDPFAVVSFQPPPPPPPIPPKPSAPPLRFQYQGLLRDDDKLAVFLVDGTQFLIAREGETIAGQYKVVKVTENNMILEYLPLHEQQTLNFGRL